MSAVIYVRVSTKEQTENLSLATQRKRCRQYCEARGIEVLRIFTEAGASAKTADRRQFQEMLSYCEQRRGEIDLVVVYSFSRFARQIEDHAPARLRLRVAGIALRSVTEATDDTPAGHLSETLYAAVAQFDNETKAERTREGMKAALRSGRWTHQAPLGYLTAPKDARSPCLLPDPAGSAAVAHAFELFATGCHTKAEVLRRVTALGLRTKRGRVLSAQALDGMLWNALYCGWMVSPRFGIRERGDFEPLVTEEVFFRVQKLLDGDRPVVRRHVRDNPLFPLRRFLRCAVCGTPLTGTRARSKGREYDYYYCRKPGCRAVKNTPTERLHALFADLLGQFAVRPSYARRFFEIVEDVWREKCESLESQQSDLRREQAKLREREDLLTEAYLYEKSIDQGVYAAQKKRLAERSAEVKWTLENASISCNVEGVLRFAEGVIVAPEKFWIEAALGTRLRFQTLVFPDGIAYEGTGFRNAATSPVFRALRVAASQDVELASPTGFELPPHGGRVSDS